MPTSKKILINQTVATDGDSKKKTKIAQNHIKQS